MKKERLLELAGIAESFPEDSYKKALEEFADVIVDLVSQDTGISSDSDSSVTFNEEQLEEVLDRSDKYGRDAAEDLIESVNKNARKFVQAWREHYARKGK